MKLSVIIPVYNKIAYLPALLEDLGQQTFTDFECILIDDGSTDGCAALCDAAARADARFCCLHIPNGGVSHARNVGLDAARGEYITFIDADDRVERTYLAGLMALTAAGAELAITGFAKVRPDGTVIGHVVPRETGVVHMQALLPRLWEEQARSGIYGYAFGKIFPRHLVEDIRFDRTLCLAEDLDFYRQLYGRIERVFLADGTGYRYLEGAENSTGSTPGSQIDFLAQLGILLRWRELLRRRDAYTGKNRALLEKRLADYAFFVLLHTPLDRYRQRFSALYDISRREGLMLTGGSIRRRWLFFCLRHRFASVALGSMLLYRALRRGLGRPCC